MGSRHETPGTVSGPQGGERTARPGYLETRTGRLRLTPSKRYWTRTGRDGVHLGYYRPRKPRSGQTNGSWILRRYLGAGHYETNVFAEADDYSEADGCTVLSYSQAIEKVQAEQAANVATSADS